MIIALDCDGVIADIHSEFELRIKKDFDLVVDSSEWTTHYIADQVEEISEQWVEEQLLDPTFWLNSMCRQDAWFMINKWFMAGHDVYFVTCRGTKHNPNIERLTERWLYEWELNYNKVLFSQTRLEKYKTCQKIGADLLVEDDPHEVLIASEFLPSFLINHKYNQNYDIGSGTRIESLYDIDSIVMK